MAGPLAEAAARLRDSQQGGAAANTYVARVLEPSPPAVVRDPFADDPTAVPPAQPGVVRVGPVDGPFDTTWHELAQHDDQLAQWCADRWLGTWRPLAAAPPTFAAAREQLHTLAEHVLTPVREHAVNRISLRWTRDGFGIPYLPGDRQVRVDGTRLVVTTPDGDRDAPLTTPEAAAAFAGTAVGATGAHYKPLTTLDPAARFDLDPVAVSLLADWFGYGTALLEQVRYDTAADGAPGRVHLWPEHFDVAIEVGDEAAGKRASVGASPGDAEHAEPYLYVAPWSRQYDGIWNDAAFGGASLSLAEIVAAGDGVTQRRRGLDFLRTHIEALR
jgi:hypothetical protein